MHAQIITFPNEGVNALPKVKFGGYIYAIEFSTGLVKVGKTQNPSARLESHRGHGSAFGANITRFWISDAHDNYSVNEKVFIRTMRILGGKPNRAEYFTGVSLEKAVQAAGGFDYLAIDNESHEIAARKGLDAIKGMLWGDRDPAEELRKVNARAEAEAVDPYLVIDRLFGAIIGATNNAHVYPRVTRRTIPLSMLRPLAELKGIPVAEIAKWNMIDMLQETASLRVRVAALQLTIWAKEQGRDDLLAPMIVEVSA